MVLPQPGGPQRMKEVILPDFTIRPSGASGPTTWSCPTTSLKFCGRKRSASGRLTFCENKVSSMAAPTADNRRGRGR